MFALNIGEDGRILSATYQQYAAANAVLVETLPDGDISDYIYTGGEYVFDPLPEPEPEPEYDEAEDMQSALELMGVTVDG